MDESKGSASYLDENTVIVSRDFGKGTLTTSGYPRQIKLWKRGTSIDDAKLIYEGDTTDVGDWGGVLRDGSKAYTYISRALTTFSRQYFIWKNEKVIPLQIPEDCEVQSILNNQLVIQLKSDWKVNDKTYLNGTLLSLNFTDLLEGNRNIHTIFEPDEFSSISEVSSTKNKLLVNLLTNVTSQLYIYSFKDGKWSNQKVDAPNFGTISIIDADDMSDKYFFSFQNFVTPSTLYSADAGNNTIKVFQSLPSYFDASKYEVHQYKAKSKDGTMVPYFMVSAKDMKNDSKNPTLVYAYGGFEIFTTTILCFHIWNVMARKRRCICISQYSWRWRIRPQMASGWNERKATKCIR